MNRDENTPGYPGPDFAGSNRGESENVITEKRDKLTEINTTRRGYHPDC